MAGLSCVLHDQSHPVLVHALCCAGLPTIVPTQDTPPEVLSELLMTLMLHEKDQNADAILHILSNSASEDINIIGVSVSAHMAVFDVMSALRLAITAFAAGDISQKLEFLQRMMVMLGDHSAVDTNLMSEVQSAQCSEAECLSRFGHRPISLMGQQKTVADLHRTSSHELPLYVTRQLHARWSNGYFPKRCPHAEELGSFPIAELLPRRPSHAEQLQQLGACSDMLSRPEGLGQLQAALHLGLYTSLTHSYLAAAYENLGDDRASNMHVQAALETKPDPRFVTVHHLYMDSMPDGESADGLRLVNKRQRCYEQRVTGKCSHSHCACVTASTVMLQC